MAVSMQSTESGGVVNFSVGDALTVNGVQVYHADGAYNTSNGFSFDSLPVKANDAVTSVINAPYNGSSMYVHGTFYSYR